jgi:seryl-tRNA synthetase
MKPPKSVMVSVRVSEVDRDTIKKSRYTFADAIEYFARMLRKNQGIIPGLYRQALEEELKNIQDQKKKFEEELEELQRREREILEEIEQLPDGEPWECREAVQYIIDRLEERGYSSPRDVVNGNGEDLIQVASRIYGVPEEELAKILVKKGIPI